LRYLSAVIAHLSFTFVKQRNPSQKSVLTNIYYDHISSVNLEHNSLTSFGGLVNLINLKVITQELRPFSSSLVPLFQNEALCKSFHMKISLICMKINLKGKRKEGVVIRRSRVQCLHSASSGICFSVVPSSNPQSRFVDSQLVCLLPQLGFVSLSRLFSRTN